MPGVLTGTYPGGFRYPFGIVPGVTCGKRLFRAKGGAEVVPGGMETWGGRRSAAYASMCGPLLPFLREGRPGAGFGEFSKGRVQLVRILTKSTLVLVTEVLRLVLPIRSHPINPIRSSPAGGGPVFFPGRAAHIGARFRIRARCAGG